MTRDDRWQHLVNVSFSLSEKVAASPRGAGTAEARALLDEVLEVFPDSIDPVEDFEGYAIRRMALALRDSLNGN